jgi:hypothetical protein
MVARKAAAAVFLPDLSGDMLDGGVYEHSAIA